MTYYAIVKQTSFKNFNTIEKCIDMTKNVSLHDIRKILETVFINDINCDVTVLVYRKTPNTRIPVMRWSSQKERLYRIAARKVRRRLVFN